MNRPSVRAGGFALVVVLLLANLLAVLFKGNGNAIQIMPQVQAGTTVQVEGAVYTCSEDGKTLYRWQGLGRETLTDPQMVARKFTTP